MQEIEPSPAIRIVSYQPEYRQAFFDLNHWWIEKYFEMEAKDYETLRHPETYILEPGGAILVALSGNQPVGVCALLAADGDAGVYELAKMGVDPGFQGRGVGRSLGAAVLERAHQMGATKVFLESNRTLTPALQLYRKLGFREVSGIPSPYRRSDIRMEVDLS